MNGWEILALSATFLIFGAGFFFLGAYFTHRIGFWHVRSDTLERAERLRAAGEIQSSNPIPDLMRQGWRPPMDGGPKTSHPGGSPIPGPEEIQEEKAWREIEKTLSRG